MTTCTVCELHAESVFKIEGMDCHEEVTILEQRLKRLAGLEALDADVLGQRLSVKYDAAKLTTSHIAEAVAQTGMRAWLEHEEPRPAPARMLWRDGLIVMSGVLVGCRLRRWSSSPAIVDGPRLPFALAIVAGGVHTAQRAWISLRGTHPRHLRADAGRRRRRGGAGPMVRRSLGRLPLRARAAARDPGRWSARGARSERSWTSRLKRHSSREVVSSTYCPSTTSASATSSSSGPARKSRSMAG